ncbi:MAG: single-stranded DNA-binding protein [Vulcanococcus sp.]
MNELIAQLLRSSVHRFIGRLGGDPELRYFESGSSVANANIAINKPGAKKNDGQPPDWIRVEVWGEQAQQFADAMSKGALLDVTGRVKTNTWQDRNGETKTQLVVTAEQWAPVGQQQPAAPAPKPAAPATKPAVWEATAAADYDNDIPF